MWCDGGMTSATDLYVQEVTGVDVGGHVDGERLLSCQPQRRGRLALQVLKWNDPHANQVAAVDALVALRDHRSNTLKVNTHPVTHSHVLQPNIPHAQQVGGRMFL